ncbi:MAG: hypothetical protein Q4E72_04935 [bacterium]|nr:hypothetical protein [bacterium]
MTPEKGARKGRFGIYLGLMSLIAFATLLIVASTLIFSHTAEKAADQMTISLGRFYLEEIADRNVYEISAELSRNVAQLQPNFSKAFRDFGKLHHFE